MSSYIFDTHSHYDDKAFDSDRDEILGGLLAKGIGKVVDVGADMPSSKMALELAKQYEFVYAALGVHPSEVEGLTEDDVLGVAIADDTVLVNFSAHMADAIRASKLNQRMMAYQLTGALVQRYPVRRVRFFFDGEAKNTLDGDVMWAGEFLIDYVLCE